MLPAGRSLGTLVVVMVVLVLVSDHCRCRGQPAVSLNSSSPLQANLNSVTFKRANLCYPGSYCYGYIGTDPACDMILGFALTGEGIGATRLFKQEKPRPTRCECTRPGNRTTRQETTDSSFEPCRRISVSDGLEHILARFGEGTVSFLLRVPGCRRLHPSCCWRSWM